MDDLQQAVLMTMAIPGAITGLVLGFRRGIGGMLVAAIAGLIGGVVGGLALGTIATQMKLAPPFNGPLTIVVGSVVGAAALAGLLGAGRRMRRS